MKGKKITFIGGVGALEDFGGELLKNKEILKMLECFNYKVNVIDTYKSHHSINRRIKVSLCILFALLFRHKDVFFVSTSFRNVYGLFRLMYYLPFNYDVVHWVIGTGVSKYTNEREVDLKYIRPVRLHIVEAQKIKDDLEKNFKLSNLMVLYNFRQIKYLPQIHKYDDDRIHFLFFSRITPPKGVDVIMSAVSTLNSNGYKDKYCIDFYGEVAPEYKAEFDRCIEANDNLDFCGTVQLREWSNYSVLARYHYMLFPTYWSGEGFPGAIIDSYIAGVPIIASDWACVPEFVEDGKTGLIIPAHDENALINVMQTAIEGRTNCMELSNNCQRKAVEFDTKNILKDSVIESIVCGKIL